MNFTIYGFHAVTSFLQSKDKALLKIKVAANRHDTRMQELLAQAKQKHIAVDFVTTEELDNILKHTRHQGVLAEVCSHQPNISLEDYIQELNSPFLLILDSVQDPHNLGACIRTANAAGVDAVIIPRDRAAGLTPVVAKVASGATAYTPVFPVTNLARTLSLLKSFGIWLYGASERAESLYNHITYSGPTGIILGSESKGLRRLTEKQCDFLIRIPMLGTVPNLNVSVAAGICLFEVVRQKSMP